MMDEELNNATDILAIKIGDDGRIGVSVSLTLLEMSDAEGHHIVPSVLFDLMQRNEAVTRVLMEAVKLWSMYHREDALKPKAQTIPTPQTASKIKS